MKTFIHKLHEAKGNKPEEHRMAAQIINKKTLNMIIKNFMTMGINFQNGLKPNSVSICLKNVIKVIQKKI